MKAILLFCVLLSSIVMVHADEMTCEMENNDFSTNDHKVYDSDRLIYCVRIEKPSQKIINAGFKVNITTSGTLCTQKYWCNPGEQKTQDWSGKLTHKEGEKFCGHMENGTMNYTFGDNFYNVRVQNINFVGLKMSAEEKRATILMTQPECNIESGRWRGCVFTSPRVRLL